MLKLRFNPYKNALDLVDIPEVSNVAEKLVDTYNCDTSTVIGDVVRPSEAQAETVVSLTSNVYSNTAIGVVLSKPTPTTCEVLISGKVEGLSGLTFGRPVFVAPDGSLTTVKPTTGHLQHMGLAIRADAIFLLPSTDKVIQNS